MLRDEYLQDTAGTRRLRLGQKVAPGYEKGEAPAGIIEHKTSGSSSETEWDLMPVLQKIYDLLTLEPELEDKVKERVARILARCYQEKEPGFTLEDAYKTVVRDHHPACRAEEEPAVGEKSPPPVQEVTGKQIVRRRKAGAYPPPPMPPLTGKSGRGKHGKC